MSLSIAAIVAGSLSLMAVIGGAVGYVTHSKQERSRWAAGVWRDVTLRNGVTERSPFHAYESSFNAPGMVEVFPRSHRRTSPIAAPTDEPVHNARPRPTSVLREVCNTPVTNGLMPVDEPPTLPLELSDPPHPNERDLCRELYQQDMSQTRIIKTVWGVSKGSGYKYQESRRRFRAHVREIAKPGLRQAIEREELIANAE